MSQDNDPRFAVSLILAIAALVVIAVVSFGTWSARHVAAEPQHHKAAMKKQAAGLTPPLVITSGPAATFLFAPHQAGLPPDAITAQAFASLLQQIKQGASATIVPFTSSSTDEALAGKRAADVRTQLERLGAPAARLLIAPTRQYAAIGDGSDAQRVEVLLDQHQSVAVNGVASHQPGAASGQEPAGKALAETAPAAKAPVEKEHADKERAEKERAEKERADKEHAEKDRAGQHRAVSGEGSHVAVEQGVVRFHFAVGSSRLPHDSSAALRDVLHAVRSGDHAVISGYTDATGDAAANERLARDRAVAVREKLLEVGVPADRIVMERPISYTGGSDHAKARRVDVILER